MAKRRHRCDVPGCERERARWQRLCETCFAKLPGDIRSGIISHFKSARFKEHRAECRRARDHFANQQATAEARSRQAFERTEQLLGEH